MQLVRDQIYVPRLQKQLLLIHNTLPKELVCFLKMQGYLTELQKHFAKTQGITVL